MSINLDAYDGREIQHFLQLLGQAETKGITDIFTLGKILNDHILQIKLDRRKALRKIKNGRSVVKPIRCPSCGRGDLRLRMDNDGFKYEICSAKCGFSRPVVK